jgi:L-ascorbate oxidase
MPGLILNAWQVNGTYTGLALNSSRWEINRHSYIEGNRLGPPALVTLYKTQNTSAINGFINYTHAYENGGFYPVTNIFPIKLGYTIEIIFQLIGVQGGVDPDIHPWHVHGQNFYDMGVGPGEFTDEAFQAQLVTRKPVQRDTTMGYSQEGNFTHQPFEYQEACYFILKLNI